MIDLDKFSKAMHTLKPSAQWTLVDDTNETSLTEELFNDIDWVTGEDSNGIAITTKTNPHSEITFAKVVEEINKL
tara:strand:+ start:438 stop:662 length:225 start_codon:yes stop_codon:yes gene_type:complete